MFTARRGALGLLVGLLAALATLPGGDRSTARRDWFGRVLHEEVPLGGATVRWQAKSQFAVTDALGRFALPGPAAGRRVTAWKEGFFIAGTEAARSPLELRLASLPHEDHEAYDWVDPMPLVGDNQRCGNCHGDIYREWSGGGHARSATGRHFRNLYEGTDWHGNRAGWSLLADHPDGAGVCAACHAPSLPPGDPARFDLRQVTGVAARGVHCDYCHKIADVGGGEIGLSHGTFNLRLLRPAQGQLFFGPLDDVDRGEDTYSPLYRDSRYCASCHEGVVFGVPVYTTWSEWLASPARREGKHCQDCHMKPTGRMTNVAPGRGGLERDPRTLANHRFFAGSREEMLRRSLKITATAERQREGTRLVVELLAENVGHRVPTGFVDRHLLLHVEASDSAGRPVGAREGPLLPAPAGPDLAGRPGRLFAKLLRDGDRAPVPFWRFTGEPEDTRLFPGRKETTYFLFPSSLTQLRIQLIYRRFWQPVAREKGWPEDDLLVTERILTPRPPVRSTQVDESRPK